MGRSGGKGGLESGPKTPRNSQSVAQAKAERTPCPAPESGASSGLQQNDAAARTVRGGRARNRSPSAGLGPARTQRPLAALTGHLLGWNQVNQRVSLGSRNPSSREVSLLF